MKSICQRRTERMAKILGWLIGFAMMLSMGMQVIA